MTEREIFEFLKQKVIKIQQKKDKPVLIAINGIEGTGKTMFANNFARFLKKDMEAIQVSIDGFHFNKEKRYKQGRDSALGYYEDSYDELSFVEKVLKASQSKCSNYTIATHNLVTDEYLDLTPTFILNSTIIITDGAYLFKPNYCNYWDLKIYLKTNFQTAMQRGIERDKQSLGGFEATKQKFIFRYHKASKIYIEKNKPEQLANIIIDNTDFNNLKIIKNEKV